ncbi:MAG: hypothetical protein DMG70_02835, partial [Acidobacteria bacterium]
ALLKMHPKTLQKMARNGEIAGDQVGRLWRFRASVLNAWLEHKMASRSLSIPIRRFCLEMFCTAPL